MNCEGLLCRPSVFFFVLELINSDYVVYCKPQRRCNFFLNKLQFSLKAVSKEGKTFLAIDVPSADVCSYTYEYNIRHKNVHPLPPSNCHA